MSPDGLAPLIHVPTTAAEIVATLCVTLGPTATHCPSPGLTHVPRRILSFKGCLNFLFRQRPLALCRHRSIDLSAKVNTRCWLKCERNIGALGALRRAQSTTIY